MSKWFVFNTGEYVKKNIEKEIYDESTQEKCSEVLKPYISSKKERDAVCSKITVLLLDSFIWSLEQLAGHGCYVEFEEQNQKIN